MPMTRAPGKLSRGEEEFALLIRALKFPEAKREYLFSQVGRKWRFDFAWPELMLAVEIDGVVGGAGGRHQRREGFATDLDKHNEAQADGWRVFRFTPDMVRSGAAADRLECVFRQSKV